MTAKLGLRATMAVLALLAGSAAAAEVPAKFSPAMTAYVHRLHAAIVENWLAPETAVGLNCAVEIVQQPGGKVVQASFGQPCNADAQTRDSIRRAIFNASPLPYTGFEQVFESRVILMFQRDGH